MRIAGLPHARRRDPPVGFIALGARQDLVTRTAARYQHVPADGRPAVHGAGILQAGCGGEPHRFREDECGRQRWRRQLDLVQSAGHDHLGADPRRAVVLPRTQLIDLDPHVIDQQLGAGQHHVGFNAVGPPPDDEHVAASKERRGVRSTNLIEDGPRRPHARVRVEHFAGSRVAAIFGLATHDQHITIEQCGGAMFNPRCDQLPCGRP